MLWREIRTNLALIVIVSFAVGIAGCWNPFSPDEQDKPPPGPVQTYDRTTWNNLMAFFAKGHEDREIEKYDESLHPDYSFVFSEDDRNDPSWDWREWIAKVEDVQVTEEMFGLESVIDIRVTFTNMVTDPDSGELWVGYHPVTEDSVIVVYWGLFGVDMHVVEDKQDQEIDHWVDGRAHIYLLPDPLYEDSWTIWKIEDLGNEHKKKSDESTSWGNLKRQMR
ncbi:MAG: hypothetical protein KAW17_13490 [Candidatus Eisenbacteria sp.]|nr:hypothetical protein [Candidatus Eisenbacteria bacterium]